MNRATQLLAACLAALLCSAGLPAQESPPTDPESRPVMVACFLSDVRDIDDAGRTVELDLYVRLRWQDDSLCHDGPGPRIMDTRDAWHPALQVLDDVSLRRHFDETLEVAPDGAVQWRQRFTGSISFAADYADFPFDEHRLPLRFVGVPSSPPARFVLDEDGGATLRDPDLFSIPNWSIADPHVEIERFQALGREAPAFTVSFRAARNPGFYVWKLLVPLCLVVMMSWSAFWVDPSHVGPQISVSVTSMLTLIAFRLSISYLVPNLPYLTRLDGFMLGATLLVLLALGEVVWTSRLTDAGAVDRARIIDRRGRVVFPIAFVGLISFTLIW